MLETAHFRQKASSARVTRNRFEIPVSREEETKCATATALVHTDWI